MVLCTPVFCQTGTLAGTIFDAESKTPLELATVSILRPDSSLLTYQLSDKEGKFSIQKLPLKKPLLVSVSYTGYNAYYAPFELDGGKKDSLRVMLTFNLKDTNAVILTSTLPVRMNADTLEINPAAFKLKPDAVVEELLNQVAGIMIWSDGSITMNGRKVQNLLVDGKPFLGSTDTRVATQNLPKSAIDKIQLYQEYDRANINQLSQPQDSTLTMNIKLKDKSKKGYFGKVGFGYGTMDRFESDFSMQVYTKRSSGGIGGGFNNINKNIGNLQDMFQNNTYRNYNPNLYNVGRFGNSGINKNHSVGALFSHSFIQTANSRQNNRIAVNYNKSGTDTYVADLTLRNRTTINNPQFIREEGQQNNITDRHDAGMNYVKTNSYNDNLGVNTAVNLSNENGNSSRFTEVRDSVNALQSTNRSTSRHQRRSDNQSVNFNYSKADRDNPLKSFNVQGGARRGSASAEREVRSLFESMADFTKNTAYNREYVTTSNSHAISGTLDYTGFKRLLFGRFNFFGININLAQTVNYNSNSDDNLVNDYDSAAKKYVSNDKLTNGQSRELFEYTPSLALSKSLFKYNDIFSRTLNLQVKFLDEIKKDKHTSSITERNLARSFEFFRHETNINYNYQKHKKYQFHLSANYSKNFQYPSIDLLYTIVDDINVYDTRIGNPFLRNRINHSLGWNGGFNTQKPAAIYGFSANFGGGYTRSLNPFADSTINDPSGRRISYYTNADKSNNLSLNYNINMSRKIRKNSIQLNMDGRFNTGETPNYVDGRYNISATENLYGNFNLQYSLKSILVLSAGTSIQRYSTKQTAAGLRSFKNTNQSSRLGLVLNYPKHFSFSSTLDHVDNSNLAKPTILWNSFATYRFMKQQAEVKFSAMDLLKQYQNISNSVGAYGTSTSITNGLQQYFLLTFAYYPRKFGKKEVGTPAVQRGY